MPKMSRKTLEDHKLIGLVQARQVIYDKTCRFYASKHHVRDAWTEIAIEMDSTAMVCQKRWRYLRDYFVRQLHTSQQSPSTYLAAAHTKKKSIWSLFEHLKFLAPFSSTRRGRPKARGFSSPPDRQQEHSIENATNDNSLSSNSTQQTSYDLNYLHLLRQQFDEYMQSSDTNMENNSYSDDSGDQYMIVDVDHIDDQDNAEDEHRLVASDEERDNPTSELQLPEQPSSVISSPEVQSSVSVANSMRSHHSEIYDELIAILKSRRSESEYDEHEHFFKSLLGSVRKIDEQFVMPFRSEIMQIVSKYLCLDRQKNGLQGRREEPFEVVVIETDQLHWRRNLCKYI